MAPFTDIGTCKNKSNSTSQRPPRLSMENLQRTLSDISWDLIKEDAEAINADRKLVSIPEVEYIAKCECCGLSEECTQEYIKRVRDKFEGRLICGLCAEAVIQEMEKNGSSGKIEEALNEHMNACIKFNRLGRAYPVLFQAQAMREILKNSRAKSVSPREKGASTEGGKIARTTSCIPAFSKEIKNTEIVNQ